MDIKSIVALSSMCIATGAVYTVTQTLSIGKVVDALFVSMLIFASIVLLCAIRSLSERLAYSGIKYYGMITDQAGIGQARKHFDTLVARLTDSRWQAVCGVGYGLIVSAVVYSLVWPDHVLLRILLALFIWSINYVTGVAFYCMIVFLYMSKRMALVIPVSLWMPNTPPVRFLTSTTRTIGILTSVYVSICISSILFSVIPIQSLVITYAIFSSICILCSIAIPAVSIASRRAESKMETIDELDERILAEYERISGIQSQSIPSAEFESLQHLLQLRDRVAKAPCWPFKLGAITTGLVVVLVSSVPVIIQVGLDWYINN